MSTPVSALNLGNCATQGNLGLTPCNIEPQRLIFPLAVPKGFVIPNSTLVAAQSNPASFFTYINTTLLKANSRSTRAQKLPQIYGLKDNTKEVKTEDQDGQPVTVQYMPYDWSYKFTNGGLGATWNIAVIMRLFYSGQQNSYDFLFFDANNQLIGTSALDNTGLPGLGGIAMSNIIVDDPMIADASKANTYSIRFVLANNNSIIQNFAAVACSFQASTLVGLTDCVLSAGYAAPTTTVIKVFGMVGGKTLWDYQGGASGALMAAGAWVVTDNSTPGTTFTITGVTSDTTNKGFILTGTWSTTNTGDSVSVSLAAPATLSATPYFQNLITEGTNVYTYTAP